MVQKNGIRLIVFDADGTLVETRSGKTFRETPTDWQPMPGREEKLKALKEAGIKLAIASNQGGVAFGIMDAQEVKDVMQDTADHFGIDYGYWCFDHPKGKLPQYTRESEDRKPNPGMIQRAILDAQVSPSETLMVGDRPEDEQAAKNAGVAFCWANEFFS